MIYASASGFFYDIYKMIYSSIRSLSIAMRNITIKVKSINYSCS